MFASFNRLATVAVLAALLTGQATSAADAISRDVVIYGGTSAAIATAVQVKRMGHSVIVVSPDKHLGGLSSGGLGYTDSGNKDAIGGISREFYSRAFQHYQNEDAWAWQKKAEFGKRSQGRPGKNDSGTMWVFEPHVAEKIFEDFVRENDIEVLRNEWLDRQPGGVSTKDARITEFRTTTGKTFIAKMFVDATYEGDLLAAAGVSYHVGREANSVYGESWNGVQVGVLHHGHWFEKPISPYVTPGDPDSGLLPEISSEAPGKKGDGDHRLQAYCFRMCLTNVAENRLPFPKPKGYDAERYRLLLRVFNAGWRGYFRKFDMMPNFKTDTNNHGPFSTDFIGGNYDYPEADYETRQAIIDAHVTYQQGLMYFMTNDPRVPEQIRSDLSKWGLAKDEFTDNGGWPHQLYIREARRMIGHYVMTEHDCLDQRETPDSVGMGSYTLDSHNVQRYIKPDGFVQNEGDIGVKTPRPYEIAYGSIIPKKAECENLLVPVCVSSSHIAFGSIRMEPVFMILGQSAATAACLAIDNDVAVQDVEYAQLQKRLQDDHQVLDLKVTFEFDSQELPGIVVDDRNTKRTGSWQSSHANRRFVDAGYQHNGGPKSPDAKSAVFATKLKPGRYEVRVSYPPNNNRATNVPIKVTHAGGTDSVTLNQRKQPPFDGLFASLGTWEFGETAEVSFGTENADGYVIIDAVQFLPND